MLTVTGPGFDVIKGWRDLFSDGDKAMELSGRAMAEEVLDLTHERFRSETDPYGKRWKPKKRPDGRKVLSGKTSALKNGWHIVRLGIDGWMIAPSVDYAAPHQKPNKNPNTGKLYRPRRMMVPDGDRGLPRAYREAMTEAASDALAIHFSGGGSLIPASLAARFSVRDLARRVVKQTVAANG